jgi:hypothetical protein
MTKKRVHRIFDSTPRDKAHRLIEKKWVGVH